MAYAFDGERDPIVVVELRGRLEHADLRRVEDKLGALIASEKTFALIVDFSELDGAELAQIQTLTSWFGRHSDAANQWVRGVAFVITTPLLRSSLETAMRKQRMPMPLTTVKLRAEAMAWAERKLDPSRSGRYRILPTEGRKPDPGFEKSH